MKVILFLVVVVILVAFASGIPHGRSDESLRIKSHEPMQINKSVKIASGTTAAEGQFPYQASVNLEELDTVTHICGGVILSNTFIVTAAMCVYNKDVNNLIVTAGELTFSVESGYEQQRDVMEMIINPNFDDLTFENDIALLKLSLPLTIGFGVSSIPLTTDTEPSLNVECVTLGWGITSPGGKNADTLQYISVSVFDDKICDDYYGASAITHKSMICAGDLENNKDFCQGDEGGALTCNGYLHGISSWGYGCGENYPSLYTQISYFTTWISDQMQK